MIKKILPVLGLLLITGWAENDGKLSMDSLSDNKLSEATLSAGDEAMSGGKFDDAAVMYIKAYNANPDADTAISFGHALRLSGKNEQAVVNLKQVAEKFTDNAELIKEHARHSI